MDNFGQHLEGWFLAGLSLLGTIVGGAAWVGRLQGKITNLEADVEDCKKTHTENIEHNTMMVQRMSTIEESIKNVDRNVERLLDRREER